MNQIRWSSILVYANALTFCLLALLLGCVPSLPKVNLLVAPEVRMPATAFTMLLEGQIVCDGNIDYVPRTVGQKATEPTSFLIRYEYDDVHERFESRAPLYLFHPLIDLLGKQPAGMKTTTVFGRLTVLDGEKALKTYEAVALLSTPIEGGQTMTAMRKQGLLAVRNSIEGQMYQDRAYFQGLRQ